MNVRGVSNEIKRKAVLEYHRKNADVLVMLETHSEVKSETIWQSQWGGKILFSHGTSMARGVAVCLTKKLANKVKKVVSDDSGRFIILDLIEDGVLVTLAAIYAPNKDDPEFFRKIRDILRERSENKVIIGDFNLVLDVELDRLNTYHNNERAKSVVEDIMDEFCMKDVWRIFWQDKKEYSWRKKGELQKASRIDFALVSAGLDQLVKHATYLSSIKTDHRAIYVVIDTLPFERGKGFWKLNTKLLKDQQYIEYMKKEIEHTVSACKGKGSGETWENLKIRIKKSTQRYSRLKGMEARLIISQLSEKVNYYEENLPLNEEDDRLWQETRAELEDMMVEKAMAMLFRSKIRWMEEGEKNTKYFFSLEKARYNAKTCFKLVDELGGEITNPQEILEKQKEFYSQLYKIDEGVVFNMRNNTDIMVPTEIRKDQDEQITVEHLVSAIKGMNNEKTPGQDGIPVDFYKVFWVQIQNPFIEMVKECYEIGKMHESARKGILNLIPKANKDTRYIKNLRPITLLNTDYKIIEKAVANKMIPALKYIIQQDQRGFMKDRRISVNIRKLLDIIHYAKEEDLQAVILSLDFVKCFDKCSFSILHGSLDYFGFGKIVKDWTEILYKDFTVKIQNNGYFSSEIPIEKGVHQGGCCSSVYFLIIAEILAITLRSTEDIEGIEVEGLKQLLNQFADDMDVCSLATEKSIKAILEELEKFKWQSGFTVSYDKTTMYRIGSLRFSDAQLYDQSQVVWSNEDINVLGVTIAHEDIVQKNYQGMIVKVRNTLNAWYNRGLSLIGKVQVVNTLIASLFVYKAMVLPIIPKSISKSVDNEIRDFLWNKKKSKISLATMQLQKKDGGLGLVNIQKRDQALKSTWPQILEKEPEYAQMVYKLIRVGSLKEYIWRCNIDPKDVKSLRIKDQFWEDVLYCWSIFNRYYRFKIENQIIWYNSMIKVGGKLIMWRDVFQRGLIYVYQLFDKGEYKTCQSVWEDYGLTVLRYNSLKAAIPVEWKVFFQTNPCKTFLPLSPSNYDMAIHVYQKKLAKIVYQYILDDVLVIHNKYLKWSQEIGPQFCEGICQFGLEHLNICKITNITKYRSFQYRFLQRGLVTNVQLSKWGIQPDDRCYFCKQEKETILHLIVECNYAQQMWIQLANYISNHYNISEVNLQPEAIVLNKIVKPARHAGNFLCLCTKQYIYSQKCLGKELNFYELSVRFKKLESMEKYIAVKNNKLSVHSKKWGRVNEEEVLIEDYVREYMNRSR